MSAVLSSSTTVAGGAPAPLPRVLAAHHTRIVAPLAGVHSSYDERVAWLADEMSEQVRDVVAAQPGHDWLHLACTSCLSPVLTGWTAHADALCDRVEARCAVRPLGLVQAYQCAGWGYALRFAGLQARRTHVMLSIVDADVHDAVSASYVQLVGEIGFGVTTLGLELPPNCALPLCDGPFPSRGFNEFLHGIRALHRREGRTRTFIPFLHAGAGEVARRIIGADVLAPNRHDLYGHTFGSDPWIGLIEWLRETPPAAEQAVTLAAFAYDGHFTLCNFAAAPTVRTSMREFDARDVAARVAMEAA